MTVTFAGVAAWEDVLDRYGELGVSQEEELEELGLQLPRPSERRGPRAVITP